ncbi:MAG: hypothetical protein JSS36_09400 [Proteobacteria bacterium]|nr:hypothetical protein [Pseudomonadota bacterium]
MIHQFVTRLAALLAAMALIAAPQSALAIRYFVANALGEVKPAEKVTAAKPKPVQVLFEFQRDGKPNARATKVVAPWAIDAIKGTGNFTTVSDAPAPDGAIISIKFNNLVIKEELDKAKSQAFGAGLSFGLLGGVVATDHYVVTIEYVAATGATPIRTEVRHELISKYGNKNVEIPGTEYKNADEAVKVLVRQALDHGINTIVADPAFPK